MAVSQINASFQNDGNFSQLDLRDVNLSGPLMRIETFRCSQPEGKFGVTDAGTNVKDLAGSDHLSSQSNRVFRHVFSSTEENTPQITLEIRETFHEDRSMEVRTRDLDDQSETFGQVFIISVSPSDDLINLRLRVRAPDNVQPIKLMSPLESSVTNLINNLNDLGSEESSLGELLEFSSNTELSADIYPEKDNSVALESILKNASHIREVSPKWTKNVKLYERMGDFRDKCIHPGTNLTGSNTGLASEYLLIRAYRISLILDGIIFDDEMVFGSNNLDKTSPLNIDPKPGVYAAFLSAYALNIAHYQLGLDKVHSDYGGIPMSLSPGSRLENSSEPLVDATNVNRMLAVISGIFYAPDSLPATLRIAPAINSLSTQNKANFLN